MIRKYKQLLPFGTTTNVVGYAIDPSKLPDPMQGAEWKEDASFREAEALLKDPDLQRVFEVVRKHGATTVKRLV